VTNLERLDEFLAARPSSDPLLAALARSLAAEIDARSPGMAANSKEYRATIDRLRGDPDAPDPFDRLFAEMGDTP
jgi:hypothetical protein